MSIKKLKKIAAAVAAAFICITAAAGISVSAKEKQPALCGAEDFAVIKYDRQYAKLLNKCFENDKYKTVAYGKSKTKKFIETSIFADTSDIRQYKFEMASENELASMAYTEDKLKMVSLENNDDAVWAIYIEPEKASEFNSATKEMTSFQISEEDFDEIFEIAESIPKFLNTYVTNIDDSVRIKTCKFKSNRSVYIYEEIEEVGFLFNEDGQILAVGDGAECICINISFSVDDSDFKMPSDYKLVDPDRFYS